MKPSLAVVLLPLLHLFACTPGALLRRPEGRLVRPSPEGSLATPLVLVPCFSGAPWDLDAFPAWAGRTLITGALGPEKSIEAYADRVATWTEGLPDYILVGDSFGALVALALAERRPAGLRAVVLSGGFAKGRFSKLTPVRLAAARMLGQAGFGLTVRMHVDSLTSHFDPPGTSQRLRDIFNASVEPTTFLDRADLALSADLRPNLSRVEVPVFMLTPEEDTLVGPEAARELLAGLKDGEEQVLKGSGHLLRFTHSTQYAALIESYLQRRLPSAQGPSHWSSNGR